ncbi:hypothetical protein QYF61_023045 [Mycteria americana]|uniref:EMILIN-1 n=1 Tax=Mycteria americana TaxID=33587 RepID=A0AAN7NHD4_MYCAM|nr:hypothetical protein QYF61_023045 [Mycteria americana]
MAPWLWPCLLAAQALAANFPPRYSLYTGGAAPLGPVQAAAPQGPATAPGAARAASRHRNWCAYVVTRSVSCVVEDGVESFVKPDYQPCGWGQLQCPRVLAYRSFLQPRYKVSQRTVSELAWRCCQGYSGEDCTEGPAPAPPQPTGRPRPRPGRPTLSGFGNPLSGLGGEGSGDGQGRDGGDGDAPVGRPGDGGGGAGSTGGGDAEKVRRLEEQVRRLSEQVEALRAGQEPPPEPPGRAAEGGPEGEQPADAAAPAGLREALSHVQRRLERLESRLRGPEGGREVPGAAPALRELEQRLQETCAACAAGTEGLRRQAAEDRERMRALEKLVGSVDQRNREAVETVQRHVSSLSGRLAPAAPPDDLHRRLAELERRLEGLPAAAAGPGGQGPVLARRLAELEGRLNASRAGPWPPEPEARQSGLPGRLGNLSRAVEGLAASGAQLGARLAELEGLLARCGRPCPAPPEPTAGGRDGRDEQLGPVLRRLEQRLQDAEGQLRALGAGGDGLAGALRGLRAEGGELRELLGAQGEALGRLAGRLGRLEAGGAPAEELARLRNRTERLEAELGGPSGGPCPPACAPPPPPPPPRELERLRAEVGACTAACRPPRPGPAAPEEPPEPPEPEPPEPEPEPPLEGFGVFGGASPSELRALRGELAAALLSLGGLNATVQGLQDALEQADARQRQLGAVTDRIVAELDGAAAAAAARQAESEERLEGLVRELARAGGCPAGLEPRLAKLEGVCEQLEAVAGGLRGVRAGLGRHVAGLWDAVRELNGTARTQAALLEKALQAQLPRRLGALNASLQHLRGELLGLAQRDLTGVGLWGEGKGCRAGVALTPSSIQAPPGPLDLPAPWVRWVPLAPLGPPARMENKAPWAPPVRSSPPCPIPCSGAALAWLDPVPWGSCPMPALQPPPSFSSLLGLPGERGGAGPGCPVLTRCPGDVGEPGSVPHIAFSAALSTQRTEPGTVPFDQVLLNDGGAYDPETGTFTAPVSGRYLVSAVLTGHKGEKLEAVLSRSNQGIARLDSAGFQPEGLEKEPVAALQPSPGALGVFSLLLPLAAGETLCVDLVSGRLAHAPDEPLTVFSGALLYDAEEP